MAAGNQNQDYLRVRDSPFFAGMRRGHAAGSSRRSVHSTDSPPDVIFEFSDQSSSRKAQTAPATDSSPESLQSEFKFDSGGVTESNVQSIAESVEASEEHSSLAGSARSRIQRSYSVSIGSTNSIQVVSLPPTAALFYNGHSPRIEVVESFEGIHRLNVFLKAGKDNVNAGVPSRYLHAVLGPESSDVGSIASTIMYAFYLNEMVHNNYFCTVPVINMKRSDFMSSHDELKWLLDSCFVDLTSLIFVDEIDLSYYDLYGSLKLVLVNGDKLPAKQEVFKEGIVEILSCKKAAIYPWVTAVTAGEEASCCTLIAEKFVLTSPEILAQKGCSRLLLAGILLDTENLTSPQSTTKDKYIATLLINGAGRFGCNGLHKILTYKMHDAPELKAGEILRKDYKKWRKTGNPNGSGSRSVASNIGMSSIGISIAQLLAHEATSTEDILEFQRFEKLSLLMIVSGYYDTDKKFKREILISADSLVLLRSVIHFMMARANELPLLVLHQLGLPDAMRAFEIDRITSRKTIESLLEEFQVTSDE